MKWTELAPNRWFAEGTAKGNALIEPVYAPLGSFYRVIITSKPPPGEGHTVSSYWVDGGRMMGLAEAKAAAEAHILDPLELLAALGDSDGSS